MGGETHAAPFGLEDIYCHAPHQKYQHRGVPPQPPCPHCAFAGKVRSRGLTTSVRRVTGIFEDFWLGGTRHECMTCKTASRKFTFSSYNPAVTAHYKTKFPWIAVAVPFELTHKAALSRELVVLASLLLVQKVPPHRLASVLKEVKQLKFNARAVAYYGLLGATCQSPRGDRAQPQEALVVGPMDNFVDAGGGGGGDSGGGDSGGGGGGQAASSGWVSGRSVPEPFTPTTMHLHSRGHSFFRRWYVEYCEEHDARWSCWREHNVGVTQASLDHAMKAHMRVLIQGQRMFGVGFTLWNELGQPVITLSTHSTSLSDRALQMCFADYVTVALRDGRPGICKLVLDCPDRDGKPALKLIGPLLAVGMGEHLMFYDGTGDRTTTLLVDGSDSSACDIAITALLREHGDGTILGVDCEFVAPMEKNVPNRAVSLVQVCNHNRCVLFRFLRRASAPEPAGKRAGCDAFVSLLCNSNIKKVVHGNDATLIARDIDGFDSGRCQIAGVVQCEQAWRNESPPHMYMARKIGSVKLGDLAEAVLQRSVDKTLGAPPNWKGARAGGAVANWEAEVIPDDSIKYAVNDAAVVREVYVRCIGGSSASRATRATAATAAIPATRFAPCAPRRSCGGGTSSSGVAGMTAADPGEAAGGVELGAARAVAPGIAGGESGGGGDDGGGENPRRQVAASVMAMLGAHFSASSADFVLPAWLDKQQRGFVHGACHGLGMVTKSTGVGVARAVTVSIGSCDCTALNAAWGEGGTAVAAAVAPVQDERARDDALAGIKDGWESQVLMFDPRHWMALFFKMVHTQSALFRSFASDVSDALFLLCEGEVERVAAWLRACGKTDDEIDALPRRYWRSHCRRSLGSPDTLIRNLWEVVHVYLHLHEPDNQRHPFFYSNWRQRWKLMIIAVQKGQLSDPVGGAMYLQLRPATAGSGNTKPKLAVYKCTRTQSSGEGSHQHQRTLMDPTSLARSPRYHNAQLNHHHFRSVLKQGRTCGIYDTSLQHDHLQEMDELSSLIGNVLRYVPAAQRDEQRVLHVLAKHRRTVVGSDGAPCPVLRHGNWYSLRAMSEEHGGNCASAGPAGPVSVRVPAVDWISNETQWGGKLGQNVHFKPTVEDVQALSADGLLSDAAKLQSVALQRGLVFSTLARAEAFAAHAIEAARMFKELEGQGHLTMRGGIRAQRAPAPQDSTPGGAASLVPARVQEDPALGIAPAAIGCRPAAVGSVRARTELSSERDAESMKKQRIRQTKKLDAKREVLFSKSNGFVVWVNPAGTDTPKFKAVLRKQPNSGLCCVKQQRQNGPPAVFQSAKSADEMTHVTISREWQGGLLGSGLHALSSAAGMAQT